MALNAAVFIIASKLVVDPLDIPALGSNRAIAMIQVGLSVCRGAHSVGCLAYMRLYGKDVLTICEPDGTLVPIDPSPVFEVCGGCSADKREASDHADVLLPQQQPPPPPVTVVPPPPRLPPRSAPTTSPLVTCVNNKRGAEEDKKITTTTSAAAASSAPSPPPTSDTQNSLKVPFPSRLAQPTNNNRQFGESIINDLLNEHKGNVPMVLPYTLLWKEEEEEAFRAKNIKEDEDDDVSVLELETVSSDTGSESGSGRSGSTCSSSIESSSDRSDATTS